MAFHPEKCVVVRVPSKRKPINARYTIHGHMLQEVDSSKYLGVTISKNHINTITAKANRTLGFLRRNMRGCKSSARAAAYQGLVRVDQPWNMPAQHGTHGTQETSNKSRKYKDGQPDL
jgi:hypothetical protein